MLFLFVVDDVAGYLLFDAHHNVILDYFINILNLLSDLDSKGQAN